ncbi:MAG: signal peptidase I, partial [Armatimonadota bacterium]
SEKDYIRRLIAVPGDTVEVKGAEITVGRLPFSKGDIISKLIDKDILAPAVDDFHDNLVKYSKDSVLVRGWRQEGRQWKRIEKTLTKNDLAKVIDAKSSEITITPGVTIKNGKALDEPYTAEDPSYDMKPVKIKPGDVWVMGDNRNNSNDCHVWGPLERKRILGKAMFIFWPVGRVRLVH